jgi:hypothetical protein
VNEHILAAIVADDETESLLRVEELHDAFALADDLGRHSTPSSAAAETAAAAATEAAASATTVITAAREAAATIAKSPIGPKASALLESTAVAVAFLEEPVALVPAATATVAFTPSVETHARQISLCPNRLQPTRWATTAQPVFSVFYPHTVHSLT